MLIRANCKINLGLFVTRKREDGYHELETVMLPVRELYDVVEVERIEGEGVLFEGRGIEVDCPADKNLCVRAARLMQERFCVGGVEIKLDKRVPFGAGLGGGSSDATAVIVAINEVYNLGLDKPTLAALAAELGSDTPFFVYNTPQLCTGRGEIMSPVDVDLSGLWLAVAKPMNEGVSTKEAYSGIKPKMPAESLTQLLKRARREWQGSVANDFEPHIFAAHPAIAELKQSMLDAGAVYAAMSGSGSAVFGLFDTKPSLTLGADTFLHIEQIE
ncbi:MAG: 4-(cytidine 5'-diphospho)-2-C-methyl-D-erythritol kinase [Alistipes sp.]|nr:4-(cytidine 5'-diphospho)-2-C-methyl-D-erythritol kinase [Alistipes sp.]